MIRDRRLQQAAEIVGHILGQGAFRRGHHAHLIEAAPPL
mgnify:CR=1 FL=1